MIPLFGDQILAKPPRRSSAAGFISERTLHNVVDRKKSAKVIRFVEGIFRNTLGLINDLMDCALF